MSFAFNEVYGTSSVDPDSEQLHSAAPGFTRNLSEGKVPVKGDVVVLLIDGMAVSTATLHKTLSCPDAMYQKMMHNYE